MKSLMNRSELLLHVTIASHCRSLTNTPAGTPGPGNVCSHLLSLYIFISVNFCTITWLFDSKQVAVLILVNVLFPQHLNLYQMPSL